MSRQPPPNSRPGKPDDSEARRRASLEDEYEERFVRPRGAPPPPPPAELRPRAARFPTGCVTLIGVVVLLFILVPVLLELSIDWQWFGSLGLQGVFSTRLTAAFVVWIVGFLVAAGFFALNWLIARRIATPRHLIPGQQLAVPPGTLNLVIGLGITLGALIMAFVAAGEWSTVLTYLNHPPFGVADPIFNVDIGFYVFELPFYEFLRGWGLGLLILTAIGVAVVY